MNAQDHGLIRLVSLIFNFPTNHNVIIIIYIRNASSSQIGCPQECIFFFFLSRIIIRVLQESIFQPDETCDKPLLQDSRTSNKLMLNNIKNSKNLLRYPLSLQDLGQIDAFMYAEGVIIAGRIFSHLP